MSIEETAGSIALLAKNGIVGEQAGTSLRGMLASLTSPSEVARKEMERLGISVFDAQGKFVGFDGVAGQLQARLGEVTDAERQLAGPDLRQRAATGRERALSRGRGRCAGVDAERR